MLQGSYVDGVWVPDKEVELDAQTTEYMEEYAKIKGDMSMVDDYEPDATNKSYCEEQIHYER